MVEACLLSHNRLISMGYNPQKQAKNKALYEKFEHNNASCQTQDVDFTLRRDFAGKMQG